MKICAIRGTDCPESLLFQTRLYPPFQFSSRKKMRAGLRFLLPEFDLRDRIIMQNFSNPCKARTRTVL